MGFLGGLDGKKESTCNTGDLGLIPGLGRSFGEGNCYPLQYPGLENSMDRGAWKATVHGVAKSKALLSNFNFKHLCNSYHTSGIVATVLQTFTPFASIIDLRIRSYNLHFTDKERKVWKNK